MAGRSLYNLPNATTVESGDKFLIQQGVNSKQVDKDVLFGGIEENLKQWQEKLYPTWIEDDGTGAAFLYEAGMIVNHNGNNWTSNEDANQDEPSTSTKWDEFKPLRHDLLTQESLNAVGGHDGIYFRRSSLDEVVNDSFEIGTQVQLTDYNNTIVAVRSGTDTGGVYYDGVTDSGNLIEIIKNQPVVDYNLLPTLNIGGSGAFSTITECLTFCSKVSRSPSSRVNAVLLSGFMLQEQVTLSSDDWSFVRITSEDAEVMVDPIVWTHGGQEGGYTYAVSARFGAVSPIFDVVFDAGETVTADEKKAGFVSRGFAKIISSGGVGVGSHLGFKNLNGRGLYCFQNGQAQANYSKLTGNYVGHRCSNQSYSQIRWSDVSNSLSFGIMCDSSYINASTVTGNDCGLFAIATNNGNLMAINSFGLRSTLNSVQIVDGGKMTLTDSDFSDGATALIATGGTLAANRIIHANTSGDAIDARTGANVIVTAGVFDGSGVGIRARFGANVEASNSSGVGCGTGIICDNANVSAENGTYTGCANGIVGLRSGEVKATGIDVSGATSTGVSASTSSKVIVDGVIADNCARPLQATKGGEIRANNGTTLNRTSQNRVLSGGIIYASQLTTDSGSPALGDFNGITAFNEWSVNGVVYAAI